jgi:hypothetical protein
VTAGYVDMLNRGVVWEQSTSWVETEHLNE